MKGSVSEDAADLDFLVVEWSDEAWEAPALPASDFLLVDENTRSDCFVVFKLFEEFLVMIWTKIINYYGVKQEI